MVSRKSKRKAKMKKEKFEKEYNMWLQENGKTDSVENKGLFDGLKYIDEKEKARKRIVESPWRNK